MEGEKIESNDSTEDLEVQTEEVQPDPLELISNQFKKIDSEMNTFKKYLKVHNEEIKMLKGNFKLLLEERE